jgi:hypothetical protein
MALRPPSDFKPRPLSESSPTPAELRALWERHQRSRRRLSHQRSRRRAVAAVAADLKGPPSAPTPCLQLLARPRNQEVRPGSAWRRDSDQFLGTTFGISLCRHSAAKTWHPAPGRRGPR